MLVQARLEVGSHVGPAAADIDAAQFEARQQRYGIDLVLAELLPYAPDARVVEVERLVGTVEIDQEEAEMPPVMRLHEGVAAGPGIRHRAHPRDALQHLAARLQAMRHGVMRPRIVAIHLDGLARTGFGLVDAMALLQPEGAHAMDEMVVGIGRQDALGDGQQRLVVAGVEGMQLADLGRHQVARPLPGHRGMQRQRLVDIAVGPGRDRGDPRLLAIVGAAGQRCRLAEIALAQRLALG